MRCGGRVERDQLHRAAAGGDCDRAMEPAASGRGGAEDVSGDGAGGAKGPIIAASDYMKALPDVLAPWLQSEEMQGGGRCRLVTLGRTGLGAATIARTCGGTSR